MDFGGAADMGVTLENARLAEVELQKQNLSGTFCVLEGSTGSHFPPLPCLAVQLWGAHHAFCTHTPTFIHHTLLSGRSVPCPRLAAGRSAQFPL